MDAFTKLSYYFPYRSVMIFQIIANIIISNESQCHQQDRNLVIALLVIAGIACFFSCFTDVFTASNKQKFIVFILPFYGPICNSLPSDEDKDRLYEYYYFKGHDLVHGILATVAFILIAIFINPVCMCIFPSGMNDGTSRLDSSLVRSIPVIVALVISLMVLCLGPPRQLIGFVNLPETCRPNNPNFANGSSASIRKSDEYPIDAVGRKTRQLELANSLTDERDDTAYDHHPYNLPYSEDGRSSNQPSLPQGLPTLPPTRRSYNNAMSAPRDASPATSGAFRGNTGGAGSRSGAYQSQEWEHD